MKELLSIYQDKNIAVSGREYTKTEVDGFDNDQILDLISRRCIYAFVRIDSDKSAFLPRVDIFTNSSNKNIKFQSTEDNIRYTLSIQWGRAGLASGIYFEYAPGEQSPTTEYESFILWYY